MNPNYPDSQDPYGGAQIPSQPNNPDVSTSVQQTAPMAGNPAISPAPQQAETYSATPSPDVPPQLAAQPMWPPQLRARSFRSTEAHTVQGHTPGSQAVEQTPGASPSHTASYAPPTSSQSSSTYSAQLGGYRSARKWFKPTFYVPALLVLAVFGGGTATFAAMKAQSSPDGVFKSSLIDALSTSNFKQTSSQSDGSLSVAATISYEASNVTKPKVYTTATIDSHVSIFSFEGYGSVDSTYLKVLKSQIKRSTANNAQAGLNKWMKVNNRDSIESLVTFSSLYDPRYLMLGHYISGNFSDAQRKQLVDYALQHKIYNYDPAQVEKKQDAGKDVYVYKVKIDTKALYEYNRKAAEMMKLDASVVKNMLEHEDTTEATLTIDIKSKHLTKVVTNGVTSIYSDWGTTRLPDEPTTKKTFKEFDERRQAGDLGEMTGSSDSSITSTVDSINRKANDVNRQTAVSMLTSQVESYYAQYGYYPTLADLNDPTWRKANLQGIDEARLQDPEGSSTLLVGNPRPKSYAYQVGTDGSLKPCTNDIDSWCDYFLITATLSDGSHFTKESH